MEVYKSIVSLIIILLLVIHILDKYKRARITGEKFSSLLGGNFSLATIIILLLIFFSFDA